MHREVAHNAQRDFASLLPALSAGLPQRQPVDVVALEVRLEASIKQLLAAKRAERVGNAGTAWDDSLAFLLMPALAAFEHDTVWGKPYFPWP